MIARSRCSLSDINKVYELIASVRLEEAALVRSAAEICARESETIEGINLALADITQTLVDFQAAENNVRSLPRTRNPDRISPKSGPDIVAETDAQSLLENRKTSVINDDENVERLIIGIVSGSLFKVDVESD